MAAQRAPRFQPGLSQAELVAGYQRIGSRRPFTKQDLQKAYQPYGLKLDKKRAKASDSALYSTASAAVLRWFKKSEADKAKAKKAQEAAKKAAAKVKASVAAPRPAATYRPPAPRPAAPAPRPRSTARPTGPGAGVRPI